MTPDLEAELEARRIASERAIRAERLSDIFALIRSSLDNPELDDPELYGLVRDSVDRISLDSFIDEQIEKARRGILLACLLQEAVSRWRIVSAATSGRLDEWPTFLDNEGQ